jgi:hypothetical protein
MVTLDREDERDTLHRKDERATLHQEETKMDTLRREDEMVWGEEKKFFRLFSLVSFLLENKHEIDRKM